MKILSFIFGFLSIVFLFASCRTTRCKEVLPDTVVITNSDSVRVETLIRERVDTVTVYVAIPAQSALQVVKDSTSHLETDFATSDAWLNADGTLGHKLVNKARKVAAVTTVTATDTVTKSAETSYKEIPVPYHVKVEVERDFTKWESFRLKAFWYLITFFILTAIVILRKPIWSVIQRLIKLV